MNIFKRIFNRILDCLVEGILLRRIREELDELLGRLGRFLMKYTVTVQPNKVFFHTQEDRYCCNPKYICEEFRKRNLDVDLVWRSAEETPGAVKGNVPGGFPGDVRTVSAGSAKYFREILSSKYVITNSVLYVKKGFSLRKNQVLFETWHGSLGIKRFGKKEYKTGMKWVQGAIHTGKMTDYCITNSPIVSQALRDTYWPDSGMLEFGHPRNDLMFDTYAEKRIQIKQGFLMQHELPQDAKFIMYGPTFRDSKNFDCYNIDIDGILEACRQRFGGNWYLLLRYHSALRAVYKGRNRIQDNPHVINVTDHPDMQELITIADIAITDYSSWIYDFMLQRRPGFIFATDISLYNNERGFCFPLESTPFPIATTREALVENIHSFDAEKYSADLEAFLTEKGCVDDGHASERVVDKILELMEQEKR